MYKCAIYNDSKSIIPSTVTRNPKAAYDYATRAALADHIGSMILLSSFLRRGYGCSADHTRSTAWTNLARFKKAQLKLRPPAKCTIL